MAVETLELAHEGIEAVTGDDGPRTHTVRVDRTLKRIETLPPYAMCHHHSIDWTTSRAVDEEDETEADEGRPPAFEDERDVDVEILTDGGDE